MNSTLLLTKWYLDVVTEDGDAVILYAAELRWRQLRVCFNSVLQKSGEVVTTRSTLRDFPLPSNSGGRIAVEVSPLGISGTWEADSAPVSRTVFECAEGSVHWNCLQPRSQAQLCIGTQVFGGLGYAECLTLTVPPWRLPMRELRWGRFVSAQDSFTWVDWQGPFANSFAYHNGTAYSPELVSDSGLVLPGISLYLSDSFQLRGGKLRKTILPDVPALAKLLPNILFGIEEYKWLSRGHCHTSGQSSSGWTIHEVVHWNR
jgi:hypothetical protein